MRRKLAAGNWKMNGMRAALAEVEALNAAHPSPSVDVLLCPPATLISEMAATAGPSLAVGAQDCHMGDRGAHTGDISAVSLADAGASYAITGHSERRADHAESDEMVRAKSEAAHAAGLIAIICLGETLAQREAAETVTVITAQLKGSLPAAATGANTVVAYEPVWAIGTGLTANAAQIGEAHAALRKALVEVLGAAEGNAIRLLYGGSVKAGNAAEIFAIADVDGALVGGASLTAADFGPIISALQEA
ncbi:MAG: triose-phosphate isomerase [Rhodobacteraceae bacterium]|nr:triose-phosphate isomerase [Paracoccaceae bacterium]